MDGRRSWSLPNHEQSSTGRKDGSDNSGRVNAVGIGLGARESTRKFRN